MTTVKKYIALTLIATSFCLPQSYSVLKLIPLGALLLISMSDLLARNRVRNYERIVCFYLTVAVGGSIWAIIGIVNDGHVDGIIESMRLYVLWSAILAVIFIALRNNDGLEVIHQAIVVSGIVIFVMNLSGVANEYFGINLINERFKAETNLYIGIMDGYIRINSNNISSLFVIAPYLIAIQCRRDSDRLNTLTTKLSLLMSLTVVVLSGRRALWICTAITPVIIAALSMAVGSSDVLKRTGKVLIALYLSVVTIGAVTAISYFDGDLVEINAIKHLANAFSENDERSIQNGYLIDGFKSYPLLGSGFGGYAGYQRNEQRPWTYESVYFQMLYNFGIIGNLYWCILFAVYMGMVLASIKRNRSGSVIAFCIIIGYLSLLIGIYSNPMLRSFDYLITIGFLPYLASYRNGFATTRLYKTGGPRFVGESANTA